MNVGRNYNGPKVLRRFFEKVGEGLGLFGYGNKQLNELNYTKAISSYSDVRMVLKHMAICWEALHLRVISREGLVSTGNPQIPYAVLHQILKEEDMVHRQRKRSAKFLVR